MTGAQNVVEGMVAWDAVVVTGDSVVLLVASPGNCRAVWGLTGEEPVELPADPAVNPPGEISVGMVEVGTLNGSELPPSVGAMAPMTDGLDEEVGDSVKFGAPTPACVGPMVANVEEPVVLDAGLTSGTTCAGAASSVASHIVITKMNIRSIATSRYQKRRWTAPPEACDHAIKRICIRHVPGCLGHFLNDGGPG
jgi:hypothetical protein